MNDEEIEKVNKTCRKIIARQYAQKDVGSFIIDIWGILEDYKYNAKSVEETFDALFDIATKHFMQFKQKEDDKC